MCFYKMRCSKSCYLCDLELLALFKVVEQRVFFWNNFLVNWTTDFYFYVTGCLISPFPSNNCTTIQFEYRRSLCKPEVFFCIFNRPQSKISVLHHEEIVLDFQLYLKAISYIVNISLIKCFTFLSCQSASRSSNNINSSIIVSC